MGKSKSSPKTPAAQTPHRPGHVKSQAELRRLTGFSRSAIGDWLNEPNCPQFEGGQLDVWAVATWYYTQGPGKPKQPKRRSDLSEISDDELFSGPGDSPQLERGRRLRADILEHQLGLLRKQYADVAKIDEGLRLVFGCIRDAGELLQRQCGAEAHSILEEALHDAKKHAIERFGSNGAAATDDRAASGASAELGAGATEGPAGD
jgi:hypothetical protein